MTLILATWSFGKIAVAAGAPLLDAGRSALDAAIAGARAVEDDPSVASVGFGGIGDRIGNVTLDACVMEGRTLGCGAVAAVENIRHVADLARQVMEKSPHLLLVGNGARTFGVELGFPLENLSTPRSESQWRQRQSRRHGLLSHDTVTVLALDASGSLGGACSTSGLSHKAPGRVGDSPIIGAGLYVDDQAGAAGATGVGEEILRVSVAAVMVEKMREGRTPQEACEEAIRRINEVAKLRGSRPAEVGVLALNREGLFGAACTRGTKFPVAMGRGGAKIEMMRGKTI